MTAATRGLGPDSLKNNMFKLGGAGMDIVLEVMLCLKNMAIPPPGPRRRGLSIYA